MKKGIQFINELPLGYFHNRKHFKIHGSSSLSSKMTKNEYLRDFPVAEMKSCKKSAPKSSVPLPVGGLNGHSKSLKGHFPHLRLCKYSQPVHWQH